MYYSIGVNTNRVFIRIFEVVTITVGKHIIGKGNKMIIIESARKHYFKEQLTDEDYCTQ
jgi:hypothetical protein